MFQAREDMALAKAVAVEATEVILGIFGSKTNRI